MTDEKKRMSDEDLRFMDNNRELNNIIRGYDLLITGIIIGIVGNISATIIYELVEGYLVSLPTQNRHLILITLLIIITYPLIRYIQKWRREKKLFETILNKHYNPLTRFGDKWQESIEETEKLSK